jgi:hypothetical protein
MEVRLRRRGPDIATGIEYEVVVVEVLQPPGVCGMSSFILDSIRTSPPPRRRCAKPRRLSGHRGEGE